MYIFDTDPEVLIDALEGLAQGETIYLASDSENGYDVKKDHTGYYVSIDGHRFSAVADATSAKELIEQMLTWT